MPVALIDLASPVNFRIPHGNKRTLLFRLRIAGTKTPLVLDPDSVTVKLEWEKNDDDVQTPVVFDPDHYLADWAAGEYAVDVSNDDLLEDIGTYGYSLTGFYGVDQDPHTWLTGTIEVYRRPGFTPAVD